MLSFRARRRTRVPRQTRMEATRTSLLLSMIINSLRLKFLLKLASLVSLAHPTMASTSTRSVSLACFRTLCHQKISSCQSKTTSSSALKSYRCCKNWLKPCAKSITFSSRGFSSTLNSTTKWLWYSKMKEHAPKSLNFLSQCQVTSSNTTLLRRFTSTLSFTTLSPCLWLMRSCIQHSPRLNNMRKDSKFRPLLGSSSVTMLLMAWLQVVTACFTMASNCTQSLLLTCSTSWTRMKTKTQPALILLIMELTQRVILMLSLMSRYEGVLILTITRNTWSASNIFYSTSTRMKLKMLSLMTLSTKTCTCSSMMK